MADISDIVTFITGTDSDNYCRDLVGYVEESIATTFTQITQGDEIGTFSATDDTIDCDITTAGGNQARPRFEYSITLTEADTTWISFDVESVSDSFKMLQIYLLGSTDDKTSITISESGSYKFKLVSTDIANTTLGVYIDGTIVGHTKLSNIKLFKADSGLYPIDNYLEDMHKKQLTTGLQPMLGLELDSLGLPIAKHDAVVWSESADIVPALKLPITDTELYEVNGEANGFVIEFVIERELVRERRYLLYTRDKENDTGVQLYINHDANAEKVQLELFGTATADVESMIDTNPHHIIIEATSTHITMIVDGVAGTSKEHSFVPSGLNFADSTQKSPIGKMNLFNVWYGDILEKYDREKSIKLGEKAKGKL